MTHQEWQQLTPLLEGLNPAQEYFLKGHVKLDFADTPTREHLNNLLKKMLTENLKPGFEWGAKYEHTMDLRPNAYTYDDVFLDILFENNIPKTLPTITGKNLHLGHVQLRASFPGPSYMDWHRDTYVYEGKQVGNLPPVHKIIFYPTMGRSPQPKLISIPGSHNRIFYQEHLDKVNLSSEYQETIYSSDDSCLLFETSLHHAVVPEQAQQGSFRLIYSFCQDFQLENFKASQELHQRYANRMNQA